MSDPKVKASVYTLVVDKDRDRVLGAMFSFIAQRAEDGDMDLFNELRSVNLHTVFMDLLKEKSEKTHALDWCPDPDCEVKK